MEEFYIEKQEQHSYTPLESLQEMLKFKSQYPILKMAKSTGIHQVIIFCEIIEGLGQFETPNY